MWSLTYMPFCTLSWCTASTVLMIRIIQDTHAQYLFPATNLMQVYLSIYLFIYLLTVWWTMSSRLANTVSNFGWLSCLNNELEETWKKAMWPTLKYNCRIFKNSLRYTTNNSYWIVSVLAEIWAWNHPNMK